MIYLRQSTASQEVPLGHFVDDTDGKTAETGLTIANTDIKVWKTGATTLANKNSGGATHISGGIYYAVLDATDTDTIGPLVLLIAVSGALAVRVECCVLDEAVFDVWFGTTAPSTLGGTAQSGDAYAVVNSGTYGNAALKTLIDTVDDFLDTEVAAIKAKTDNLPSDPADQSLVIAATDALATLIGDVPTNSELATALAAADDAVLAAIAALSIPTANDNADALLDRADAVETSWTVRQALRILLGLAGGKSSGGGTTFRNPGDTKDRIVATVDGDGNRTAVTLDAS